MEAVPDVVQLADDEAEHQEHQHQHRADLVPDFDFPGHQVQNRQRQRAHAAVDIGQALFEGGIQAAAHVAGHLAHSVQQAQPGIFTDVDVEARGEFVDAGLGVLQRRQGGQFQNGTHAHRQDGEHQHHKDIADELLKAPPAADFPADAHQQDENADEKADVIIGIDGQEQGQGVEDELPLFQHPDRTQHHQGRQGEGIQPHDVPLIAQRPGAEGIEGREQGHGNVFLFKGILQENGEEQARQAQTDGQQQAVIFQHPPIRHDHRQQIQGRRQIVGDQAQVIHAQTNVPGPEEAVAAAKGLPERLEEREILVVIVRIQNRAVAEGLIAADEHDDEHAHTGNGKGQR